MGRLFSFPAFRIGIKSIIVAYGVITAAGCAASTASINAYVDPTFTHGSIKSVAIFPMKNTRIAPSESQTLNREMSLAIQAKSHNVRIMGAAEATDILNQKGLAEEWGRFLDNYISSGIPNREVLKKIGEALNVDAIIQGEVVNIQQDDGRYGHNKGTTRVTVRYTMMGVAAGKMLWEASSEGLRTTNTTVEAAPPIIEAVQLAQRKILETIPF